MRDGQGSECETGKGVRVSERGARGRVGGEINRVGVRVNERERGVSK